jgi:hypothetical protein
MRRWEMVILFGSVLHIKHYVQEPNKMLSDDDGGSYPKKIKNNLVFIWWCQILVLHLSNKL